MKNSGTRYVVVTPVRDEEQYLPLTIESMTKQTVLPLQWVIVNDGSKDRTAEIIDDAAREHSWIRAVHRHLADRDHGEPTRSGLLRHGRIVAQLHRRARHAEDAAAEQYPGRPRREEPARGRIGCPVILAFRIPLIINRILRGWSLDRSDICIGAGHA